MNPTEGSPFYTLVSLNPAQRRISHPAQRRDAAPPQGYRVWTGSSLTTEVGESFRESIAT